MDFQKSYIECILFGNQSAHRYHSINLTDMAPLDPAKNDGEMTFLITYYVFQTNVEPVHFVRTFHHITDTCNGNKLSKLFTIVILAGHQYST